MDFAGRKTGGNQGFCKRVSRRRQRCAGIAPVPRLPALKHTVYHDTLHGKPRREPAGFLPQDDDTKVREASGSGGSIDTYMQELLERALALRDRESENQGKHVLKNGLKYIEENSVMSRCP